MLNLPLVGGIIGGLALGPVGCFLGAALGSTPGSYKVFKHREYNKIKDFKEKAEVFDVVYKDDLKRTRTVKMNPVDMEDMGLKDGDIAYLEIRDTGLLNKIKGELEYRVVRVEKDSFVDTGKIETGINLPSRVELSPNKPKINISKKIKKTHVGKGKESEIPINFIVHAYKEDSGALEKILDVVHRKHRKDLKIGDEIAYEVMYKDDQGRINYIKGIAKVGDYSEIAKLNLPDGVSMNDIRKIRVYYGSLGAELTDVETYIPRLESLLGPHVTSELRPLLARYNSKELGKLVETIRLSGTRDVTMLREEVSRLETDLRQAEKDRDSFKAQYGELTRQIEELKEYIGGLDPSLLVNRSNGNKSKGKGKKGRKRGGRSSKKNK